MPKYITFFSYSADAINAMLSHSIDRSAAATAMIEALGGTLEAFYWMQGHHDAFVISELPDGVSSSALAAAVAGTGVITDVETHEIFDQGQQAAIVEAAKLALEAYAPPD